MARIDRSAIGTPMSFVVIAAVLVVTRLGLTAASAHIPVDGQATAWKTAVDADKHLLPGAQDIVEPEPVPAVKPVGATQRKTPPVFEFMPLSNEDKESILNGKFVLYEFVADWSDPCKSMERNALSNRHISKIIESKFVPIRISDRVRQEGKNPKWISNLQKRYHVFALPTLVVVDPNGEQKAALIGNCSSLTVERFLNRVRVNEEAFVIR